MIKVVCKVEDYKECSFSNLKSPEERVEVSSDSYNRDMVYLKIGKEKCQVVGRDLITAIKNCLNDNSI